MATFSELIEILRTEFLDDCVGPDYRNSDAALRRMLIAAQQEACRRGACDLIQDQVGIKLIEGRSMYPLDANLLKVQRVIWNTTVLVRTTVPSLDSIERDWLGQAEGPPSRYFIKRRTLHLDRPSSVGGDVLRLDVSRMPYDATQEESPELPAVHHHALCYWAAYRALQRPDEDTQRMALALSNLAQFDRYFGAPADASTLEYLMESAGFLQPIAAEKSRSTRNWIADLG